MALVSGSAIDESAYTAKTSGLRWYLQNLTPRETPVKVETFRSDCYAEPYITNIVGS